MNYCGRLRIWHRYMEAQGVEQFLVDRRKTLKRAAGVVFIERIVRPLHAAVEEVAGIGVLAVVGQFRIASVHGKISGRGGIGAVDQPGTNARKAKKVENIGLR